MLPRANGCYFQLFRGASHLCGRPTRPLRSPSVDNQHQSSSAGAVASCWTSGSCRCGLENTAGGGTLAAGYLGRTAPPWRGGASLFDRDAAERSRPLGVGGRRVPVLGKTPPRSPALHPDRVRAGSGLVRLSTSPLPANATPAPAAPLCPRVLSQLGALAACCP